MGYKVGFPGLTGGSEFKGTKEVRDGENRNMLLWVSDASESVPVG